MSEGKNGSRQKYLGQVPELHQFRTKLLGSGPARGYGVTPRFACRETSEEVLYMSFGLCSRERNGLRLET